MGHSLANSTTPRHPTGQPCTVDVQKWTFREKSHRNNIKHFRYRRRSVRHRRYKHWRVVTSVDGRQYCLLWQPHAVSSPVSIQTQSLALRLNGNRAWVCNSDDWWSTSIEPFSDSDDVGWLCTSFSWEISTHCYVNRRDRLGRYHGSVPDNSERRAQQRATHQQYFKTCTTSPQREYRVELSEKFSRCHTTWSTLNYNEWILISSALSTHLHTLHMYGQRGADRQLISHVIQVEWLTRWTMCVCLYVWLVNVPTALDADWVVLATWQLWPTTPHINQSINVYFTTIPAHNYWMRLCNIKPG